MTQHTYAIADQNGLAFLADVNAALTAIVTNNSGTTEPTATFPHMRWADTTAGVLKRRNAADSGWISVMSLTLAISVFSEGLLAAADAAASRTIIEAFAKDGSDILAGDLQLAAGKGIIFEGTADDTFELKFDPGNPTADRTLTAPDKSGTIATVDDVTAASSYVPVRQTVLSGPVDTNGYADFGGSSGGTSVTASGTLIPTAANGFNINGAINRIGSIVNPSWAGLSTNGKMYLYLDIASDGTCTPGSTALAPTYRWGGPDVTTNGQFTFNIQEMVGKVGNGSSSTQIYRVFVGEVTVAGGVVTAIAWYALLRRALVIQSTIATSSTYVLNTNIGTNIACNIVAYFVCKTAEGGCVAGDRIHVEQSSSATGSGYGATASITGNNAVKLVTSGSGIGSVSDAGTTFHLTAANWSFECIVTAVF